MVGVTLWRAWTADLQAQGRYLLPIIPMLSVVLYREKNAIDNSMTRLAAITLFLFSAYSFSYIGLQQILRAA